MEQHLQYSSSGSNNNNNDNYYLYPVTVPAYYTICNSPMQHQQQQAIMSQSGNQVIVGAGGQQLNLSQQQSIAMHSPQSPSDYDSSSLDLNIDNLDSQQQQQQQQQQQMMQPSYQTFDEYQCWQSNEMLATSTNNQITQNGQQQQLISSNQYADCHLSSLDQTTSEEVNGGGGGAPIRQHYQQQQQQQQHYEQVIPTTGQPVIYYSDSPAHSSNHAPPSAMQYSPTISVEWLDNICKQLIEHMNTFGICVIDNFLGSICGEAILKEVYQLYNNGLFRKGQLVNNRLRLNNRVHVVRGDSIIWVDGSEKGCNQIEMLIQTLDSLIINCNRMSGNNGEFDEHVINQRTKAMIACYPGNGTHYIKHIDNPNGDGRCITAIYYLNKEWDAQRDGGLLRIFPVGLDEVANIAPLFDRVLFFWSDRRNPHEVLPAQRIRFAITVWFIDSNEKLRRQQRESQYQQQLAIQQQAVVAGNLLYPLTG